MSLAGKEAREHDNRIRAEVLAACICKLRESASNFSYAENTYIFGLAVKVIENLQPAASDLEEYVKNLPLSEIARIKGIPGLAKLGKTYDRPDFTFAEDE